MGFVRDSGEGRFAPNTVLKGDIRTKVKAADRIIATYHKSRGEEQDSEIVFAAKKVEWEKIVLPDEYSYEQTAFLPPLRKSNPHSHKKDCGDRFYDKGERR